VSIRPATEADEAVLHELWREFQEDSPPPEWWDASWEEEWADLRAAIAGDSLVLVAERDGDVVGYVVARHRRPRAAYLHDLFVTRDARRSGVAKELIAAVAGDMRARGAQMIMLGVDISNAVARTVYRRLGFVEDSLRLTADLAALAERVGASAAARPSIASTHVQTDDREAVERALMQFLPRLGHAPDAQVSEARNGWVSVTDELFDRDRAAQRKLGAELSERLGVPAVALALEEEEVVRFYLFDRGRMVDEYLSVPTYYGELSKADELALAANPTLVARLTGADASQVRAVARTASSPADLAPARELIGQIADVMNLDVNLER
jgi:ribosomal protein S18 acetylase RimI-like enzyme